MKTKNGVIKCVLQILVFEDVKTIKMPFLCLLGFEFKEKNCTNTENSSISVGQWAFILSLVLFFNRMMIDQ